MSATGEFASYLGTTGYNYDGGNAYNTGLLALADGNSTPILPPDA